MLALASAISTAARPSSRLRGDRTLRQHACVNAAGSMCVGLACQSQR